MPPGSKSRAAAGMTGGCIWVVICWLVGVRVADRHTAEAFELFVVGPGDILVADHGYSRSGQWAYALLRGADVVVRLAVQQVPLLDEQGQSLDVLAWLKEAQAPIQ